MMGILPEGSEIVLSYVSSTWTAERFHRNGGFVAVVLNYNKHGLIGPATQSALDQDFDCYDIVCLDDNSTDGSADEMVKTLRCFIAAEESKASPKAVRIICVVNSINQTTTRQWKIATIVSEGDWFGMFCGDDVSYPHRMKVAAGLIGKHPTVLGVCTNADRSTGGAMLDLTGTLVWRGTDVNVPLKFLAGCTAFWKSDVIDMLFGKCIIDDLFLTWCAFIRGSGNPNEILLWAMDESTVAYSIGTGVTTANELNGNSEWWVKRLWREVTSDGPGPRCGNVRRWRLIQHVDRRFGSDNFIREQIRGRLRCCEIHDAGWCERWRLMWKVLVKERQCVYAGMRDEMVKYLCKRIVSRFCGSFSCFLLKIFVNSTKRWRTPHSLLKSIRKGQ